mmetsp:Transcript_36946/g.120153  ORF Transcript_36946/g.120153 Transcript_36946/m.120153 type:complete len:212 (-) Transcript_36946:414-1049(-)
MEDPPARARPAPRPVAYRNTGLWTESGRTRGGERAIRRRCPKRLTTPPQPSVAQPPPTPQIADRARSSQPHRAGSRRSAAPHSALNSSVVPSPMSTPSYLSMHAFAASTVSNSAAPRHESPSSDTSTLKLARGPNPSSVIRMAASPIAAGKPPKATRPEVTCCSTFALIAASMAATVSSYAPVPAYLSAACLGLLRYSVARLSAFVLPRAR